MCETNMLFQIFLPLCMNSLLIMKCTVLIRFQEVEIISNFLLILLTIAKVFIYTYIQRLFNKSYIDIMWSTQINLILAANKYLKTLSVKFLKIHKYITPESGVFWQFSVMTLHRKLFTAFNNTLISNKLIQRLDHLRSYFIYSS